LVNTRHDVFKKLTNLDDPTACWEYTGYYNVKRRTPYFSFQGQKVIPYRLVYELFTGIPIPEGKMILHSCDNRKCCNPKHMSLGDHQENIDDMKQRERHGLPHHTVRAIRKVALDIPSMPHSAIATQFGTSRRNITAIVNHETYKHVEQEVEDG